MQSCPCHSVVTSEEPAKWLFRLESKSPDNGLWYDSNNKMVWGIGKICPNSKTKDLPMGYDERYHKHGKCWFSSCRKEDLTHWCSREDAANLIANGFVFCKYLARDYVEYENETTFLKETCLARVEITDIDSLF